MGSITVANATLVSPKKTCFEHVKSTDAPAYHVIMGKQPTMRLRGNRRLQAIIEIVKTDNTFSFNDKHQCWVGRCIHCNSAVAVETNGETAATVEHIVPITAEGQVADVRNLALACSRCNQSKGIVHDPYVGRGGRADEVIESLKAKRAARWRDPE